VIIGLPALSVARHWDRMDLSHDREAQDWISAALTNAAPGGFILTAGDRTTFALWYALYGLKRRPHLTPINISLYAFPWYQSSLMNHHPNLTRYAQDRVLPPLEQLVTEAGRQRSLYRTEPLELDVTIAAERPAGSLVQIQVK
jgi:hypothetical protein